MIKRLHFQQRWEFGNYNDKREASEVRQDDITKHFMALGELSVKYIRFRSNLSHGMIELSSPERE